MLVKYFEIFITKIYVQKCFRTKLREEERRGRTFMRIELGRLFIPVSFVGLVEFRENRRERVTGEAAIFTAYTSSIVESQPAPRGKGNK